MQLIHLLDSATPSAVAIRFMRLVQTQFPDLLVYRGRRLTAEDPTVAVLEATGGEDVKPQMILGETGKAEPYPEGLDVLLWPDHQEEVSRRLTEWAGPKMTSPSQDPAHIVWTELATRITTQRLHFRSGDEEAAVKSVASLFKKTRELIEKYRNAVAFNRTALLMLNELLRPYTARWHGWMTEETETLDAEGKPMTRFRDERLRRKFREELVELQPRALGFQKVFAAIAAGREPEVRLMWPDRHLLKILAGECEKTMRLADLGTSFQAEIRPEVKLRWANQNGRSEKALNPLGMELPKILARRRILFPKPEGCGDAVAEENPEGDQQDSDLPHVMDVAGLALSGGGIRSATFCLGIVQGLQARKLFPQFDYLSTVSGGGYLGAFLSCYLGWDSRALDEREQEVQARGSGEPGRAADDPRVQEPQQDPEARLQDAFERPKQNKADATGQDGSSESLALRHLRNNSRYLLNGGATGLLRILGVLLTGFGTSFIILLTLPLLTAWVLLGLQVTEIPLQWLAARQDVPWWQLGISAILMLVAVCALLQSDQVTERSASKAKSAAVIFGFILLAAWTFFAAYCLGGWLYPKWEAWMIPEEHLRTHPIWPRSVGVCLAGTFSVWLIYWIFMPLSQRIAQGARWNASSTRLRDVIEGAALILFTISLLLLALLIAPWTVYKYEVIRDGLGGWLVEHAGVKLPEYVTTVLTGLGTFIFGGLAKKKGKDGFNWAGLVLLLLTPAFFIISTFVFCSHLGVGGQGDWQISWAAGGTVIVMVWAWLFLDINTFAPHRYYRNRLCECYLAVKGRSQRSWVQRVIDAAFRGGELTVKGDLQNTVGTLQRLPLSALGGNAAAPYHLINATLNAAASKHPTLRGRDGDFFLFSRHYCGSPLSGYVKTEDLEAADPHLDLGTAMAISGAAASTNMGDMKSAKKFRFLMTLFNIRLGYWMRRPGLKAHVPLLSGPGVTYFFRELIGAVHERSGYVNLSDGGHIENLAAYELLRRQCRFIVCVDAGMEPGMECADLMRLQRYAAIDFGIDMQFDPADLMILPTKYSRAYAIMVKIDYTPGRNDSQPKRGWMLYIKLAMTGTEPRYVLDYRREHADFPHQTTGDQVYDEAQFEAYRALGECAIDSLFQTEITSGSAPAKIKDWFQGMANNLLPDNDPVFRANGETILKEELIPER